MGSLQSIGGAPLLRFPLADVIHGFLYQLW
jgi:hypothetical protein